MLLTKNTLISASDYNVSVERIEGLVYGDTLKKATIYSKTATFGSDVFRDTPTDFEIHGYVGSTSETYANANGYTFVPIDEREIIAQGYCGDDDAGDDKNTQIAGADNGQGFHQKIHTHDFNLQSQL